jgi:hypothetical protein
MCGLNQPVTVLGLCGGLVCIGFGFDDGFLFSKLFVLQGHFQEEAFLC